MKHNPFFNPVTLGGHTLKNRIVLPPLTRQRSTQPGNVANALMAEYYQQRAGAGLLITEGTQIEPRGQGYAWTPGIHTSEQIAGCARSPRPCMAQAGLFSPSCGTLAGLAQRTATRWRGPRIGLRGGDRSGERIHRNRARRR